MANIGDLVVNLDANTQGLESGIDRATKATGRYRDSAGKLREANGRFVSSATLAAEAMEGTAKSTARATTGFGRAQKAVQEFGRRSGQAIRKFAQSVKRRAAQIGKLLAGAFVAATAAVAAFAKSGLDSIDAQAKLSRQIGTSVDNLRALQIAASDAGISQGQLTSSLRSFTKRLGDAAQGTGEAQKAFEALGIDAKELTRIPLPEQLSLISDRISQLDSAAERASVADRLMSGGRRMVTLFENGGDAIRGAVDEVDALGLSLTKLETDKIEQANDAMSRIGRVVEVIRNRITVLVSGPLKAVADRINEAALESGGFRDAIDGAMATALEGASKFLTMIDKVILGLLTVQEIQLKAEAFGATIRNIATGSDELPEEFVKLQELQQRMRGVAERIASGNVVSNALDDVAQDIRDGMGPKEIDQAALNVATIIGKEANSRQRLIDAAAETSDSVEEVGEKSEDAADSVSTFAKSAERAAQRLDAAARTADPRFGFDPDEGTIESRARARFEASAFRIGDPSVVNFGNSAASTSGFGTSSSASEATGGSGRNLGSITINVKQDNGEDVSGDVQGEEAFLSRLAGALSSVSSAA